MNRAAETARGRFWLGRKGSGSGSGGSSSVAAQVAEGSGPAVRRRGRLLRRWFQLGQFFVEAARRTATGQVVLLLLAQLGRADCCVCRSRG